MILTEFTYCPKIVKGVVYMWIEMNNNRAVFFYKWINTYYSR
jgi:hypothetical protein